eukprot:1781670-Prorocentrum_lima.AAC.1
MSFVSTSRWSLNCIGVTNPTQKTTNALAVWTVEISSKIWWIAENCGGGAPKVGRGKPEEAAAAPGRGEGASSVSELED